MDEKEELQQSTPYSHEEFYNRYYVHRVAASSVVIKNEKILLVKEIRFGKYIWSLPGGLLEKGENIIDGVIREVKEETNIDIKPYGMIAVNNWAGKSIFRNDPYNQCGFLFILASSYQNGLPKPDGEEVIECDFYSIEECNDLKVHSSITNYYNIVLEKRFLPLSSANLINEIDYRITFRS